MIAQVVLIPAESKYLIAKAVLKMDVVRKALASGMVVMHPSSSTYFLMQDMIGKKPELPRLVMGLIVPKGACRGLGNQSETEVRTAAAAGPAGFPYSVAIRGNKLITGEGLGSLLEQMGPDDVYIKGVNALDAEGTVGVLFERPGAGTIGLVMSIVRKKKFHVIFPVGLEKLIPGRVEQAAKEAVKTKYSYSMGIGCGLIPCRGTIVTEVEAIRILSGAEAIPIASGGLVGAEGAVVIVVKGKREHVTKAVEVIEAVKGARLPKFRVTECRTCKRPCDFPVGAKHWVQA